MSTATVTGYGQLLGLSDRLSQSDKAEVESLRGQAISYVWGWQDAGGDRRTVDDAWYFSIAYGIHCARFALREVTMRSAIQTAFTRWRTGYPIEH